MKIKSLEAVGFKSFVDRLYLNFPEGITGIVGPNGCGKSNVVDAIVWAIGERSAKHLRGRMMEDVIFGGTEGRKPLGMAEVSLTFSNEDGFSPKGYEQYSEITVTRRFYRSGEGEYFINKIPCRLRDVTDLFLDTGIGVNGYSIVEQGRVENLINANPQDRRFLIEEAAGIAKYKERKRLALMKMEAAQQNLLRIQDIIAEVKRQIVTLERQVKRAEEYKAVRKEIREIELRFALQEYGELSEKGEASRGYLKALRERETGISAQVSEREASIEGMRLKGLEEEEKLRSLQQEAFELSRRAQRLENEIEFLRREREGLQKQEAQWIDEVREAFRAWRGALRERKRAEELRKALEEEWTAKRNRAAGDGVPLQRTESGKSVHPESVGGREGKVDRYPDSIDLPWESPLPSGREEGRFSKTDSVPTTRIRQDEDRSHSVGREPEGTDSREGTRPVHPFHPSRGKNEIRRRDRKTEGNFAPETVGAFREGREVETGPLSLSFAQRASGKF